MISLFQATCLRPAPPRRAPRPRRRLLPHALAPPMFVVLPNANLLMDFREGGRRDLWLGSAGLGADVENAEFSSGGVVSRNRG